MKNVIIAAMIAGTCFTMATANSRELFESRVVSMVVTYQDWDEDRPWAKVNPRTRRAAGVVIDGPFILTTADVVADATFIQLEKYGRSTRFVSRPVMVDPEINLALLEVDDSAFFEDLTSVKIASETPVDGVLRSVRWNGQQLESLTSRVKRFEVQESWFGRLRHVFLMVQTDMSRGGWAEPVFHGELLTGLTVSQNEQRAKVIPAEIINAYLRKTKSGKPYTGFPVLGVKWQVNEDRSLSEFLGQKGEPQGVLIRQVPWGTSGCGVLEPRDVLLSIDGKKIDAGGYYEHKRLGRLRFTNIVIDGHETGDVLPVEVLRGGRVLGLEMTLRPYPVELMLIPLRRGDRPPPYYIGGGLTFRELDGDYLRSWGSDWTENAPLHLLTSYFLESEAQTPDRRRIILLSSVMPAAYNVGYQAERDVPVSSINGMKIDSIGDVAEAFGKPQNGFHTIVLEPNLSRREIVLDADQFEAATAAILNDYRVSPAMRLPAEPLPDPGVACEGDF